MKLILSLLLPLLLLTACVEKKESMMAHEPQSFETATGMKVGAALLILHNTAAQDDELISATSTVSPRTELHTMIDDNGIMRMREVKSIPVKAGEHLPLTPDGYHIMLMDLEAPLKAGSEFDLTLNFKNSSSITVKVPVLSRAALKETLEKANESHDHH